MNIPKTIAIARSWDWTCPICNEDNESEDIPLKGIKIECEHCNKIILVIAG